MISTRAYYSPDIAAEFCGRSGQGLQLPLPQPTPSDHQSDVSDGFQRRLSPSSEVDGKGGACQTRRRVPVACQRCRKRKIKCSGDPGNGQGCSNCRSAGAAPSLCTFLRVNSRECETYLTVRGVPVGSRYSPYPSNHSLATRGPAVPLNQGNGATSAFVGVAGGYGCYNGLFDPGLARTNYPTYPVSYEDEAYSGQSPAYMLPPNNESMLGANHVFASPGSPRNWDLFSGSGRAHSGLYPDQTPPNSMSPPNGGYAGNVIPFAASGNDIPSTLVSSSSGLGTGMTSLDRILPNPATGRCQQGAIMTGSGSVDNLAMANMAYRNSIPWIASDNMSNSSQASDRVLSVGYGSTMHSNGSSGDSSTTTHDNSFAYIPITNSSSGVSSKSHIELEGSGKHESAEKRARALSEESTPSPENPMAEAYGYSGDIMIGRRSTRGSLSSGTLANGQEYTRMKPLPTPGPELYRNSRQDSAADYPSQIVHRPSVASLSRSTTRY